MYPENPEGTQVIVGFMNMGYDIYPTLTGIELTTYSVRPKCAPIPLGHSDGQNHIRAARMQILNVSGYLELNHAIHISKERVRAIVDNAQRP